MTRRKWEGTTALDTGRWSQVDTLRSAAEKADRATARVDASVRASFDSIEGSIFELRRRRATGRGRILVVDDEDVMLNSISRALAHHGYAVELAHTGELAVERLESTRYEAVIVDLVLDPPRGAPPVSGRRLNGVDVAAKARAVCPRVILISGKAADHLRAAAHEVDAAEILEKPFSTEELLEAIRPRY